MIVPTPRLLIWTGLVLVPAATLATALPEAGTVPALLGVCWIALAAFDALKGRRAVQGIEVEAPPVVRLTARREGAIGLRIRGDSARGRRLRLAPELPPELLPAAGEGWVADVPPGSGSTDLPVLCTPTRRGSYRLEGCHVEAVSPLALWFVRSRAPMSSEVRVYPNLAEERKRLGALFLNRGGFGVHAQRQVGHGREFEKLREYVPGDSYEDIHWKATARRGRPVTKVFQVERTQEVYVIVDASRLSTRRLRPDRDDRPDVGSPTKPTAGRERTEISHAPTVLERFITAALVLGLAAERQGDLFGVGAFSDGVVRFLRAKGGKAHYGACRDALYALEPRDVAPDFDEVFARIGVSLRRRALLVFLTSLDDPALAESFARNVEVVGRRHLVLVNALCPPGTRPLFSDPRVRTADELYDQLAGHMRWADLAGVKRTLESKGVGFSLLENERLTNDIVTQYLNVKQRQLL